MHVRHSPDVHLCCWNVQVINACLLRMQVMDRLLFTALEETDVVNNLQLGFLVLEGCVACIMGAAYIVYLLRRVSQQRYLLYETFLSIPMGLTRALATQSTSLLDDDASDEDEEEELLEAGKVCN